jgi:hypothetical protein
MSKPRSLRLCIITLLSCLPTVSAQPINVSPITTNVTPRNGLHCSFTGNPDIYGPGIRIGIYAQTLAVFLSKYFIISQVFGLRDALAIFSLALLTVATLLAASLSSPSSPVNAVEFFIILQILSWNCSTGLRARSTYVREALRDREARVMGMEAMSIAALGIHTWFWFRGIDMLGRGGSEGCKLKVFFFVETDLQGWFRKLMQGMAVLNFMDHAQDIFRRSTRAWGRGFWWGMRKELQKAVEEFDAWKENRAVIFSRSDPESDLATENTRDIDDISTPSSRTWDSNDTRLDVESITSRVARIQMQLLTQPGAESSPGSTSEVEAQRNTTMVPTFTGQLFEGTYAGENSLSIAWQHPLPPNFTDVIRVYT